MANFAAIAFLDTFELAGSLRQRIGLFKPAEDGLRLLPIRGMRKGTEEADEDFVYYKTWAQWVELKNMLGRIKRIGDANLGAVEFGRIHFEILDVGATLPWRREEGGYAERFSRLHLPVRTNPAALLFAGVESMHLLPGQMTVVNTRAPSSAVNLGEWPRVHLVVDFRKKDVAE